MPLEVEFLSRIRRHVSRRKFLKGGVAALCGLRSLAVVGRSWGAASLGIPQRPLLGKIKPRPGKEIAASPLGIGFETLDRQMFLPERTYAHIAGLGVKWARVQTGWCRCEREKGRYDFAWLDGIIDSLRGIGVQPWFNLGYGNQLYTPEASNAFAVGWAPLWNKEAREGWVRFVRALAEHFGSRVRHWEIWNEPNISGFWKPEKPSPAGYMDMVKLTGPEIRARAPGVVLVGGALAGMPTDYLRGCLELGLAEHVDRISYHPYAVLPELNYARNVSAWREMLAGYKPSLGLWQGECGCPSTAVSTGALSQHAWNESRQARWLLRRMLNDLRLGLEHTSWYNTVDQVGYALGFGAVDPKKAARVDAHFGLLRGTDYSPKPSYLAYQTLCALFDSETKAAELPVAFSGDFAASDPPVSANRIEQAGFVRGRRPLYAYWWPADVHQDFAVRPVSAALSAGQDLALDNPVLVDPLSGEILKLEGRRSAGRWSFEALPLCDYPILITDAAVV